MGWADNYIKRLQAGETIQFRPRGNSMTGRINDRQLVTARPVAGEDDIRKGDIVLCKVGNRQYLHLVNSIKTYRVKGGPKGKGYQIANNHGHINGWTSISNIYGKVIEVQ